MARASTTAAVLATLDTQLSGLSADAVQRSAETKAYESAVEKRVREIQEKREKSGQGKMALGRSNTYGILNPEDAMDVDDAPEQSLKSKGRR